MNAYAISGETYPLRRVLRANGCIWNHDAGAYYIAKGCSDSILEYAREQGLDVEEITADPVDLEEATGDRLREIRQAKQDRRAERLRKRADQADARAERHKGQYAHYKADFGFMTEPIKIGHHSENRHRNLRNKISGSMDREMQERIKADKLRHAADWVAPAQVKGDAEARRQKIREVADKVIGIGDYIESGMYGAGVVQKVNKKTFTVSFRDGAFKQTIDKSWARLIEKREPVKEEYRFKPGDSVVVTQLCARYSGTVKRRTARGYSVEYDAFGRTRRETFSASDTFASEEEARAGQKAIGL